VALSFDRHYVLTSSWGNIAYVWDLPTGQLIKTFENQERYVEPGSVAFSQCIAATLAGYCDNSVYMWDLAYYNKTISLKGF